MTASQVAQRVTVVPTSASAPTCTPSKSTRYCVSDAMVICWVRVTPGACGSTRNSDGPSPVRASTRRRSAALANWTWRLAPSSRQPSPSAVAARCTPSGPNPPLGSSHAGVRIASPAAIRGSHSARCSADPACASTPPLMTELTKWGDGARARPSSVYTTTASSMVIPLPPCSSGSGHPEQAELAQLRPELVGVPDRVVLHLPDDVERRSTARTRRPPPRGACPAQE